MEALLCRGDRLLSDARASTPSASAHAYCVCMSFLSLVLATPILFELGTTYGCFIIDQCMQRDKIHNEQRVVCANRQSRIGQFRQ
jgi:hypothetical protein